MPIYEYACESCGHRFEKMQKISDPPPASCPECGAAQPRKLVSRAGFQLKGSGWYVTDFRDQGKGKARDKDGDKEQKGADQPKAETASDSTQPAPAADKPAGSGGSAPASSASD